MTDLLLILFTLALLALAHLTRTLLALRIPAEVRLKPSKLKQAPDIMADLFEQTDLALTDLGFSRSYWATVHATPPLPGFIAPLIRLYKHERNPIIALLQSQIRLFEQIVARCSFSPLAKERHFWRQPTALRNSFRDHQKSALYCLIPRSTRSWNSSAPIFRRCHNGN
ncbi:MAG: hypothetical protein P8166_15405 [Candidatus Thiodiazotropha sp.]